MARVLYHLYTNHLDEPQDVAWCDGNGLLHKVPYDEPTEIMSDWFARLIVEHCEYSGIVEVELIKDRHGVRYSMEDAKHRALQCLEVAEKKCINDYIFTQLNDRIRANYPPMPPMGRQLECVIKHKTNLLKHGIRPVGWEPPYFMEDLAATGAPGASFAPPSDDKMRQLENLIMQQQVMINDLMAAGRKKDAKFEGPPKPPKGEAAAATGEAEPTKQSIQV